MNEKEKAHLQKRIAHHEKEARQWVELGKNVFLKLPESAILRCIRNANNESKEVARLVAKMNGWGETPIDNL